MGEHYYTRMPNAKSEERSIEVEIRGVKVSLLTDNGVFSKGGLDEGTRRLLECVQLCASGQVLDLGAGYGIVTAVLSQVFPHTQWTLIEVNERAMSLAVRNTLFLQERRTTILSDGVPDTMTAVFDDVLLNPPIRAGKAVVYRLFSDARRALKVGGTLWVVIQKKHGAPSAAVELGHLFNFVETAYKKSGYFIFAARNC